ncbi:MAG: glycosyltransferase family 87 protein [Solirubrobacteraceae bacterium]
MSVAAHSVGSAPRVRSGRWAPALTGALALALVAAAVEIVLDGAAGHSALIPKQPAISGWLEGVGERLGFRVFLIALLVSIGAYAGLLALARAKRIGRRAVIALIGALHVIVFAGPILLSTDVFSYIAYARMGVEHGLNPYLHGPSSIVSDPIYRYVGQDWKHVATAYGPFYTLLSYPIALLGVTGAVWGMKVMALVASVGTLALTWRCARMRDIDPVWALLVVGANPLYVIYALGGAHNDLVMLVAMMGAVSLTLGGSSRGREGGAAGLIVAGALVKATVAALLPFMIVSRRRLAPIVGAAVVLVLGALIGWAVFGIHGIDVVSALNRDAAFVSTDSFANEIAHLFGKPGVFPIDHDLLKAGLVLIVVHLLWRTWRGYDWIAAAGWSLLAISVTSTWLLAWYILWPLPLAVVSRDRRLLVATLAVQALYVAHQMTPLLAPVS